MYNIDINFPSIELFNENDDENDIPPIDLVNDNEGGESENEDEDNENENSESESDDFVLDLTSEDFIRAREELIRSGRILILNRY